MSEAPLAEIKADMFSDVLCCLAESAFCEVLIMAFQAMAKDFDLLRSQLLDVIKASRAVERGTSAWLHALSS